MSAPRLNQSASGAPPEWSTYLREFHDVRPGITERILSRCVFGALTPYAWCAEPLRHLPGPTLDLACGSGPLAQHTSSWVGTDTSRAELAGALERGRRPLARAAATNLPIRSGSARSVVCSMGLQIIQPLDAAMAEIARCLARGGRAVALLPASRPMPLGDALLYLRLQVSLRARIRYPNGGALRGSGFAEQARLRVLSDERRSFTLPIATTDDVEELLMSLYLPTTGPARLAAGRRVLAGRVGGELTVPLRRVVLEHRETTA